MVNQDNPRPGRRGLTPVEWVAAGAGLAAIVGISCASWR
jgi:hypothetical protein